MMFAHQRGSPFFITVNLLSETKKREQRKQNETSRHQQSRAKESENVRRYYIAAKKFLGITSPVPNRSFLSL